MSQVNRRSYIGGSDCAKLLGKHSFGGPRDVYESIRPGFDPETDGEDLSKNRHIMRGNACEPFARERIRDTYPSMNRDFVREDYDDGGGIDGEIFLRDPEYDFIGGHVDGLSQDPLEATLIVHEIKAPTSSSVERIEKNGIPARYFYQIQHYMGILDQKSTMDVKGIIQLWSCDDWDLIPIEVEYRPDIYEKVRPFYVKVWEQARVKNLEFGETGLFDEVVHEEPEKAWAEEDSTLDELISEYYEVHKTYKECKERRKELKTKILSQVGSVDGIETPTHYADIRDYKNSTYLKITKR